MKSNESPVPVERIERTIHVIRGQKVILGQDLAALYGVETKMLVQAVKRNLSRFPEDFIFQLSKEEFKNWKSQIVTSNPNNKMGLRKLPLAFTEHGIAMASNLLKSDRAVQISVAIVRAFIHMRELLSSQKEVGQKLDELKSFMLKHSNANDREFKRLWDAFEKLSAPPTEKEQRRIGFDLGQ